MPLALAKEVQPYRRFFVPFVEAGCDATTLTWLGTNSLYLKSKSSALLIDPYFSRLPGILSLPFLFRKVKPDLSSIQQSLQEADIKQLNAILLTHSHIDHALDVPAVAGITRAETLYTPPLLFYKLVEQPNPFQCRLLTDGLMFSEGDFDIVTTRGSHMPFPLPTAGIEHWINRRQYQPGGLSYAWQYTTDAVYNFQITSGDKSIFVMGSAGIPSSSIQGKSADVLILSVGGLDLLPHKYCESLLCSTVDILHPQAVWLSHWDDFTSPWSEPLHWLKKANRIVDYIIDRNHSRGIDTWLLPPGQACSL